MAKTRSTLTKLARQIEKSKKRPIFVIVIALFAVLGTLLGVGGKLHSVYDAWRGYSGAASIEADLKKLEQTKNGMRLEFVKKIHGEPFLTEKLEKKYVMSLFASENYFLQILSDSAGAVKVYAVTSRNTNFHPLVYDDSRLGEFTFEEFAEEPELPKGVSPFNVSAKHMSYAEKHYFGNPGNYQYYFLALNKPPGVLYREMPEDSLPGIGKPKPDEVTRFRRGNVPNTFAVSTLENPDDELSLFDVNVNSLGIGIDYMEARSAP